MQQPSLSLTPLSLLIGRWPKPMQIRPTVVTMGDSGRDCLSDSFRRSINNALNYTFSPWKSCCSDLHILSRLSEIDLSVILLLLPSIPATVRPNITTRAEHKAANKYRHILDFGGLHGDSTCLWTFSMELAILGMCFTFRCMWPLLFRTCNHGWRLCTSIRLSRTRTPWKSTS